MSKSARPDKREDQTIRTIRVYNPILKRNTWQNVWTEDKYYRLSDEKRNNIKG